MIKLRLNPQINIYKPIQPIKIEKEKFIDIPEEKKSFENELKKNRKRKIYKTINWKTEKNIKRKIRGNGINFSLSNAKNNETKIIWKFIWRWKSRRNMVRYALWRICKTNVKHG